MRITSAAEFGQAIRKRRKELGYTQGYLSEVTGLSISFISDLERGKETAELGKTLYVASLLGLDITVGARGEETW